MSRPKRAIAPLAVLAVLAAAPGWSCRDKTAEPAPDEQAKPVRRETPPEPPPEPPPRRGPPSFAGIDLRPLQEKLEGLFLFDADSYRAVWSITGGRARVFERGDSKRMTVELVAPCLVRITERLAGGARAGSSRPIAFAGDDLVFGAPIIGVRLGDRIAACTDEDVFLYQDGSCSVRTLDVFDHDFQSARDAECGPSAEDDTLFTIELGGTPQVLESDGDVFFLKGWEVSRAKRPETWEQAVEALGESGR